MRVALNCALGAIGCGLAMASGSARAAIEWDYILESNFVNGATTTYVGAGPGSANGCETALPLSITWGSCNPGVVGKSSIGISNTPRTGTLTANGPAQPANTYTHSNNVVSSAFGVLQSATITSTFGLKLKGSADPYVYMSADYQILFVETPNIDGTCVADSPVGNPCNDIWVLDGPLNHTLTFGGTQFYFSFYAEPALNPLPDAVCAAAGAANGCIGFTTTEGQNNEVNFLVRVTSAPLVPGAADPVAPVTPIPTLSEWGVLLFSSVMAWAALRRLPLRRGRARHEV